MKKTIFILALFAVFHSLNGQSPDSSTVTFDTVSYEYNLYGLGNISQRISFLSPLKYMGQNFSYDRGKYKQVNKKITSRYGYVNIGFTLNSNMTASDLMSSYNFGYIFNRRYQVLNQKLPEKSPSISLGFAGWVDYSFDTKNSNVNNALYYNLNNMIGLSIGLEKKLKISNYQIDISNELTLPLLGFYSASEHGIPVPYIVWESDANFFKSLHAGSLETNFQFRNNLNFDMTTRSKNPKKKDHTFRIQYGINYTNLNINNNNKTQIIHSIKFNFNLFNKTRHVHK